MKRENANIIIEALKKNKEVAKITIKDKTVDTRSEFTLDDYNNKELELTADYVVFRLKVNEKNTNEKQFRCHFESVKRIVINIHYRDIVASDKRFNVKSSSIDYVMSDDNYDKAIQDIVDVHKKYLESVNKVKKNADKVASDKKENKTTSATKKTEKNKEAK